MFGVLLLWLCCSGGSCLWCDLQGMRNNGSKNVDNRSESCRYEYPYNTIINNHRSNRT